jgi:uncharacterized protein YjbK
MYKNKHLPNNKDKPLSRSSRMKIITSNAVINNIGTVVSNVNKKFQSNSIDDLVDFVEIKWNICEDSFSKIKKIAEEDDDVDTTEWNTYLYDTQSLELLKNRVVLRIRKYNNSNFKSSLKQNLTLDEYPIRSLEYRSFICEGDYTGNREKIGCSLKHKSKTIQDAFSKDQEKIIQNQFNLSIRDLNVFGPTKTTRITFKRKSLSDNELVIEIYETKAGTKFVEFSTRSKSDRFLEVYGIITKWLLKKGINICPVNVSKPESILLEG